MPDIDTHSLAPTGVAGLDTILHGGLPQGRLHLLQGPTGSGKTTLALQFALAGVMRSERTVYVSLAESEAEIASIAASHGWSVDGMELFYQGSLEAGNDKTQTVLHPMDLELPAVLRVVLDRVESFQPSRVVIDSLTELRILAREPRWYRHELTRLRTRLEALACTTLVLDTGDIAEAGESLLGGVIRIDHVTPIYGPDRRRLHVAKMRGHDFETGYHDVRIQTGGLIVYPRLVASQSRGRVARATLSTGLSALDTMLGGGLDEGTAVLLLGPTGSGKSTLALQCATAAAQRGQNVLVFIFDERLQTVFQRSESLGIDLERQVEAGRIVIRQVDPAEMTPGEFAETVRSEASERGVKLIVVDSLNAYIYAMPDERLLNVHLHELLAHLSQQGVTSVLIGAQHGTTTGVGLPSELDVSYLADTVVLLRVVEDDCGRHKAITVYKRRAGKHDDSVRELHFGPDGITLGDAMVRQGRLFSEAPFVHGDATNA